MLLYRHGKTLHKLSFSKLKIALQRHGMVAKFSLFKYFIANVRVIYGNKVRSLRKVWKSQSFSIASVQGHHHRILREAIEIEKNPA